ncbi:MAG TPA: ABC transporter permease [Terracidiphilus sp.]|nr:ABC transporter permease [Terracidiphilus sp.]
MAFWRQLTRGLEGLLHRSNRDAEIDDELQHYFEEAVEAQRQRGLTEEEARRAARLEFGSTQVAAERVRSCGWENSVRTFLSDLHYAGRQLRRNPGFTVVCVVTLALGIGASTAIFSAVNPILFKPLPYPHPDRILMIWNTSQGDRSEMAYGTWRELAQRSRSLDATAIFEPWQPAMTGGEEPKRLDGESVSAGFFRVLGAAPAFGRDFRTSDEGPLGRKIVILSNKLSQRLFDGDQGSLGHTLKLDGDLYTVIGVMPRGFHDVLSPSAELWTPDQYDVSEINREFETREWGNHLHMVGRLRAGVTVAQAAQELNQIARNPWPQFPRPRWAALDGGMIVDSLQGEIVRGVKPALLAVFGAVLIVLLIACVNVANLLIARGASRVGEFAVRGALGASRVRIVRQLVTESMLLSCVGGALGIAVAWAGVHGIVALSPPQLPRLDAIVFDRAAFLFGFALVVLIGLIAGLFPALQISRNDLQPGLQLASHRVAGKHFWMQRALAIAEIAMALVLLVSTGLLLRSMQRLLSVRPGLNPSHLLTMQVVTSGHRFDDFASDPGGGDHARREFFEQALEAVRRVPGVESAAFTSLLPLSGDSAVEGSYGAQFSDEDADGGHSVFRYAVSPGYCRTMGIPIIRGRFLDEHDIAGAPQAALISESLARRHFGDRNPIGSRLHLGPRNRPWYTVVGVVGDVKQTSLSMNQEDAVYLTTAQSWFADDALSFVIRTRGNAAGLASEVTSAIWSVDKNQPIVRVATMDRLMAVMEAQRRFILILFGAFGVVALLLAAIGLYGVLSGSIAERMHEMGVRMALGASRGDILALAFGSGMRLTAWGIALGACGALAASRGIASLLFGTSSLDPVSWLGMVALLAAVAALACWVPARRGAGADPARILRSE